MINKNLAVKNISQKAGSCNPQRSTSREHSPLTLVLDELTNLCARERPTPRVRSVVNALFEANIGQNIHEFRRLSQEIGQRHFLLTPK